MFLHQSSDTVEATIHSTQGFLNPMHCLVYTRETNAYIEINMQINACPKIEVLPHSYAYTR